MKLTGNFTITNTSIKNNKLLTLNVPLIKRKFFDNINNQSTSFSIVNNKDLFIYLLELINDSKTLKIISQTCKLCYQYVQITGVKYKCILVTDNDNPQKVNDYRRGNRELLYCYSNIQSEYLPLLYK